MSKEEFEQASLNLYKKMHEDGIKGIIQYRPFSDEYWEQNPKIVICNYENYGYQEHEKPSILTYEDFKWWFDERLNKTRIKGKSKTVHYTVVFANILKETIQKNGNDNLIDYTELRRLYWKYDELYKSMKNMMYMNIRPSSAKGKKQEIEETHGIIRTYKAELKAYLQSLDADIFVLSTKDAVILLNSIFELSNNSLFFNKATQIGKMKIFSVRHFGRPNYKYWYKRAIEIANIWFNKDIE